MIAKQTKKKNSKHAAATLLEKVYRHETSLSAGNKLITIMYKYFIAFHVGHIQFLITSFHKSLGRLKSKKDWQLFTTSIYWP